MLNSQHHLMAALQETACAADVTTVAGSHFNELGFEKFAYVLLDPPNSGGSSTVSYVSNYPLAWQEQYIARDYFQLDPVYAIAHQRKQSFVWGSDEAIVPLTARQKQFFQESGDVGTHHGLSVPVLLPQGRMGLLSLCSDTMNTKM